MTNLITEARELCERATPGPWGSRIDVGKKYYVFTHGYGVRDFCCLSGGFEHESDAAFIARSRTLIPELCDALEKAEEQNKQLLHEVCNLACESVKRDKAMARLETEVEGWAKAEQEGRLVVLPCNVGDTVWTNFSVSGSYLRGKDRPYPCTVLFIGLNQSESGGYINVEYEKSGYQFPFDFDAFGKTVFLTTEEAEAKLKELSE